VSFDKPVPVNGDKIPAFPESMVGVYFVMDSMFQNDSNKIIYNGRYFSDIYKQRDSADILELKILISKYWIEIEMDGKSYFDTTKIDLAEYSRDREHYKTVGKYLVNEDHWKEIIFNLQADDILKSFDGKFYLNQYNSENDWGIYQMVFRNDSMLDVNIMNPTELGSLPWGVRYSLLGTCIKVNQRKFRYLTDHNYFKKLITIEKYTRK
jgi:hypothetical protein